MSEPFPKSKELVQAQIAAFAAEKVEHYNDHGYILNNIGSLALGGLGDIRRVNLEPEHHSDGAGGRIRVPEGTERVIATRGEYTNFLRKLGGSSAESIRGRADIIAAYNSFSPIVDKLKNEVMELDDRSVHHSFLGKGLNSTVFLIEYDGAEYAVRIPKGDNTNPRTIDSHIAAGILGRGLSHLEQIVAASYEDGVTVAEMMPGKELGNLTISEVAEIPDTQLNSLVETIINAHERGIIIDPKPSNFLYDPEEGFGIVDYLSPKVMSDGRAKAALGDVVGWGASAISSAGFYGKKHNYDQTEDDYAGALAMTKANLVVMKHYRNIVESRLEGEERDKALESIDTIIGYSEQAAENQSKPEWIAERMAYNKKMKRIAEEHATKQSAEAKTKIKLDII